MTERQSCQPSTETHGNAPKGAVAHPNLKQLRGMTKTLFEAVQHRENKIDELEYRLKRSVFATYLATAIATIALIYAILP